MEELENPEEGEEEKDIKPVTPREMAHKIRINLKSK